jgi:L-asparaginase
MNTKLITHGTDTMTVTAVVWRKIPDKVIALDRRDAVACFRGLDALFNLVWQSGAQYTLAMGVHTAFALSGLPRRSGKENRLAGRASVYSEGLSNVKR